MTTSARTVETNTADALARLLTYHGDTGNLAHWMTEFEGSFSSPIVDADVSEGDEYVVPAVVVSFEDGSVLHLTVTQIKEPNQ